MNNSQWIEFATLACQDAGIIQDSIEIITTTEQTFEHSEVFRNNSVFRLGDQRILKIIGTDAQQHFNIECAVLQTLSDEFPAPRLIASGILENESPYIIMSEVTGKTLQHMWDDLSPSELRAIAREIGTTTEKLHHQPQDKLAEVEAQFGGRQVLLEEQKTERITEIEIMDRFSTRHKDELLEFLHGEARHFLDVPPVLTHSDFSHAHVYIAQEKSRPSVTGFIDWGEAMLGPPEWDIAFHWFWTFSQDHNTMIECLNTYYQDVPRPSRFARRCFATHLYTFSMNEVWDYFTESVDNSESIVQVMIRFLFPPEVFGAPD
jgi:aminoglycoside phosphotransferase (APT) family kinase protein